MDEPCVQPGSPALTPANELLTGSVGADRMVIKLTEVQCGSDCRSSANSEIQETHVAGISRDERPTGLHVLAHQDGEQLVCRGGIVQCYLE